MKRKRAFTLVELMIVVSIIAILAVVSVPMYSRYRCRSNWSEIQACLADIEMRLLKYYGERGTYPVGTDFWGDLGFNGEPNCGTHYNANVSSDGVSYIIYFVDDKQPLTCTRGSALGNDVWAKVDSRDELFHVKNTVNETQTSLPAGYSIP